MYRHVPVPRSVLWVWKFECCSNFHAKKKAWKIGLEKCSLIIKKSWRHSPASHAFILLLLHCGCCLFLLCDGFCFFFPLRTAPSYDEHLPVVAAKILQGHEATSSAAPPSGVTPYFNDSVSVCSTSEVSKNGKKRKIYSPWTILSSLQSMLMSSHLGIEPSAKWTTNIKAVTPAVNMDEVKPVQLDHFVIHAMAQLKVSGERLSSLSIKVLLIPSMIF